MKKLLFCIGLLALNLSAHAYECRVFEGQTEVGSYLTPLANGPLYADLNSFMTSGQAPMSPGLATKLESKSIVIQTGAGHDLTALDRGQMFKLVILGETGAVIAHALVPMKAGASTLMVPGTNATVSCEF